MVRAAGPERRTMPIPPRPGGVEMATMVSSNSVTGISYGNGRKIIGVVEGVFCWGFCEKWCAERGFLMVKTWWIAGETW